MNGINPRIFEQEIPEAVDSIFPDWFFTLKNPDIPGGVLINGSMFHPKRRLEHSEKILRELRHDYAHFIDLSYFESENKALEMKGVTVFDYRNRKVYLTLSARSNIEVAEELIRQLNMLIPDPKRHYRLVTFTSQDKNGEIIYHTDVMMTILHSHIVINTSALCEQDRERIIDEITSEENDHPYEIIDISFEETDSFGSNMFNLLDKSGNQTVICSKTAYNNFTTKNLETLCQHYKLVPMDVSTIELLGGGSTRCMMVELF